MKGRNIDLCRPCLELLREHGEKLELVKGGSDYKITCSHCGRRRYGATYQHKNSKSKA